MPRPSGTEPSLLEKISTWLQNNIPPVVYDLIENTVLFVWQYWYFVILAVGSLYLLIRFYLNAKRHNDHIQKLWQFMLFFLSKRLMILPLVYTLGKRDNLLDTKSLQEILEIRKSCQNISLIKNPAQRLVLEQNVSKMLFHFFSGLEKTGKISMGSKFDRIIKDLEYIDQKLFTLRDSYNAQVETWNNHFGNPNIILYKLFLFSKFEKF